MTLVSERIFLSLLEQALQEEAAGPRSPEESDSSQEVDGTPCSELRSYNGRTKRLERMRTALLAGAGSKCPTELAHVVTMCQKQGRGKRSKENSRSLPRFLKPLGERCFRRPLCTQTRQHAAQWLGQRMLQDRSGPLYAQGSGCAFQALDGARLSSDHKDHKSSAEVRKRSCAGQS